MKPLFYRLEGHTPVPCADAFDYASAFEAAMQSGAYIVAQDYVDDVHISTVFLWSDHNYKNFLDETAPPLLFETMVFVAGIGELRVRYETWDEAAAGHRLIVDTIHRQHETAIDHADALLGHLT
jgi:hypothetical protein